MKLTNQHAKFIFDTVEKRLIEIQCIDPAVAHRIVINSSLNQKINETPTFVAHCSIDQLVDLVLKETKSTSSI